MKEERQTDMGLDVQNKKAEFFTDINNADRTEFVAAAIHRAFGILSCSKSLKKLRF